MRPLVAHCYFGLGKRYRRTGQREQAREHHYREYDVSRDEHAVLAGAGGGGDLELRENPALAILGLTILVPAPTAEDPTYRGGTATPIS
jgi:hypothetical protein